MTTWMQKLKNVLDLFETQKVLKKENKKNNRQEKWKGIKKIKSRVYT